MPINPRLLTLSNRMSPGDVTAFTGAVRDLHETYPGEFQTCIDTAFPELWLNNPYNYPLKKEDTEIINISHQKWVNFSNKKPWHMVEAYRMGLEQVIKKPIRQGILNGEMYLTDEEKVQKVSGNYWIINCGGKNDATVKWWNKEYAQEVVDYFQGQIKFVQIGASKDYHPRLNNVVDLVGKTSMRDLLSLLFNSQGVVCPITFLMHLSAAVPTKNGGFRPTLVLAGGREPLHWFMYPGHNVLHTLGALDCCLGGGCWKHRIMKIDDGKYEENRHLCVNPESTISGLRAKCMNMITSGEVILNIEKHLESRDTFQ